MKIVDLKMGTKLYVSFFIIIAIFALVSAFQVYQMSGMAEIEHQSSERSLQAIRMGEVEMLVDEVYVVMAEAIINRDVAQAEKDFAEKKAEVAKAITDVNKFADHAEEKEWAKGIESGFNTLVDLFERRVLPVLKAGNFDMATFQSADRDIDKIRDTVDDLVGKFHAGIEKENNESSALYDATYDQVVRITVGVILLGMLIGFIFAFIITRYIKRRLIDVVEVADMLAQGDLTKRVERTQKDEFGDLANSMNKSIDDLEQLISDIVAAMQNLAQAVEQISSGNQNLSQRTSEQASSLEEVASTIEQATATIKQNAENAQEANRMSEDSLQLGEEGNRVVVDAVTSINEISDSSKKIGEIISVINEIAFQTNLLALNAAVEAARAGEQGRGFAVVAGEVRNLAQRAGSAAKEISVLIKDSLDKVDRGTELSNKSGEALKEVIASIRKMGQFISEIAAASEEQRQGIDQINIAISEMDSMTQQNAALVEETASASEEMANQAQDLIGMTERFRLRDAIKGKIEREKRREIHLHAAELNKKGIVEAKAGDGDGKGKVIVPVPAVKSSHDELIEQGFEEF
jgi:methyl-accepting chemotaxis protein